jgi:transcriptional/translational regulatory protein YebC/TACO1
VRSKLEEANLPMDSAEVMRIPTQTVELSGESARRVLKLIEALDDHDDVQSVSANFSISEEMMAELS